MKWFNLSLLLMALVLGVMLVVEPFVLARIGPVKEDRPAKLPSTVMKIKTLSELSSPLPEVSTLKKPKKISPRKPTVKVKNQKSVTPTKSTAIAQTQALKIADFAEQPMDSLVDSGVLTQDISDAKKELEIAVESVPVAATLPVIDPVQCFRFGPLVSFSKVQAAGDQLVKRFEILSWGEVEEAYTEQRHWIVLAGARTAQQAGSLVKQLDGKGFRDHYLPLSVEEPHLVSLGIFKDRTRADRHLSALGSAGFGAELRARELEFTRRWLTFETAAPRKELAQLLTALDDKADMEECLVVE